MIAAPGVSRQMAARRRILSSAFAHANTSSRRFERKVDASTASRGRPSCAAISACISRVAVAVRASRVGDMSPTLLALTATATREMQAEIAAQLGRPLEAVEASTFRSNLRLEVFACANADDKMRRLAAICRETPGAAIIYANSRERCEKLATFLRREGLQATHYHAGLEREERQQTQERFM